MDGGKEIIAKISYPKAHQHFTTASQVATMDYVRNVPKIPTSRIYTWSSATDNPMGAVYNLLNISHAPIYAYTQIEVKDDLKVAPHLLPSDKELSKPVLWDPDLQGDNIFVNPDQPSEIVSIIDWQAVNPSPLFLQARHPALVEIWALSLRDSSHSIFREVMTLI
ncbi:hypothetical protein BJX70DRAFT_397562 [Aspergillus crustosus]